MPCLYRIQKIGTDQTRISHVDYLRPYLLEPGAALPSDTSDESRIEYDIANLFEPDVDEQHESENDLVPDVEPPKITRAGRCVTRPSHFADFVT